MYMNKLEKEEKLFKSCFKRKISITLGALVVFMMTGCGGGGGSSSSGSSPSYNVQGPVNSENSSVTIKPENKPQPPSDEGKDENIDNNIGDNNQGSNSGAGNGDVSGSTGGNTENGTIGEGDKEENPTTPEPDQKPKPESKPVEGTTLQATKNEDGSYTLTDKNNSNVNVTGTVTEDGGFTITSDITAADGSSLKGVTVKKETPKAKGDRYSFTKDGKTTFLNIDGNGNYTVEKDGTTYTVKDGDKIATATTTYNGKEFKYQLDKDKNLVGNSFSINEHKVEKHGDLYLINKVKGEIEATVNTLVKIQDLKNGFYEVTDTTSAGRTYIYKIDINGKAISNKFFVEIGDKKVQFEKTETGFKASDRDVIFDKNKDGNYVVTTKKDNTDYRFEINTSGYIQGNIEVTTIKDGNTYSYTLDKNGQKLDNKVTVNGTDLTYENNGTFTIDSGTYKGTKITKSSTGYDIDGKINSNGKETTITFKLDSKGKVTGEINVAGQNYELAQSSSGLTGIKKDGAIYTGVSGYGTTGKEEVDYGASYIYEKDGKKYHVLREMAKQNNTSKESEGNTATYVDITGIDQAINGNSKTNDITADDIVKHLYQDGKAINKLQQTPAYVTENGNIGQYYNWNMKTPEDGVVTKSVTGIDLINNEKLTVTPKTGPAIGQGIIGGGAYAYNFGTIDVQSTDDIAVGQYLSEETNAVPMMGSFNFGLINVKAVGEKTVYDKLTSNEKINGAGVYVEADDKSYVTAVNYGKIVVDNSQVSKTDDKYYSVGMVANGKKAQAFNFGTIEVKGADNPVILQHGKLTTSSVFMTALNGGSIYNYGTFKSDASVNIDNSISTSTKAKYVSGDKITFSNDVAVLSEVGKGNEYVVEDFVTAKNGVEGLDKLKATGVYSVTTVEDTDADGNKVVDLKMTKTKKLEELTSGELARKIKEAGLDSYVYADGTGKYAEEINFLANENRVADLSKYFSTEYDNLNGAILETSRRMMDDSVELANADRSEFSGDFDRNFKGILASKDIPNLKLGVFKNYRKDANYGAGMDYDRDSVTVIVNQKINEKFSLNYGYENTKNKYDNGSKLDTHNFMLGVNYVTPTNFYGMDYNFIGDIIVGRNKMEKNGEKGDNFYTYSVGMLNSLNKNLELSYFNKSNLVFGLRTVVFGHESITDKTVNNRIEDSLNLSNSFVAGLNLSKEFGITKNAKLKLTSNFGYEKELMKTSDWRDSVKMNDFGGTKFDMSTPMKDDKGGRAKALVKAEVEFNNGFSTGVYGSVDSLGYKEVGVSISYKF